MKGIDDSFISRYFMKGRLLLMASCLFFGLFFVQACGKNDPGSGSKKGADKKGAAPVEMATAVKKDVPLQINAIGNIQAIATVSIKSQVEGEITGVHFREGQEVKTGDPLFTIDPRVYEAQVKQAEAALIKDRAQLANTKKQLERYAAILRKGITEEQYDQLTTSAASIEAAIKSDEASIESAKLKVSFCSIKAPITGITGSLRVSKGNIVKANDNDKPLVTINQIKPIYAVFSVPETNLPEIRTGMSSGKIGVSAVISDNSPKSYKGELTFIENSVDVSTGSIIIKATFPNDDSGLWPGQFANIAIVLGTMKGEILVPSQAILSGQKGEYVLVVKDDDTVEFRSVKTGLSINGDTVISDGLNEGEKVVTDGQMKLSPGAKVKAVEKKQSTDKDQEKVKKPDDDKIK